MSLEHLSEDALADVRSIEMGLIAYLRDNGHEKPTAVVTSRISGGYSRSTWSVDVGVNGTTKQWIVSLSTDGAGIQGVEGALSPAAQARLLGELHRLGLPVPRPLGSDDTGTWLGRPFLATQNIPGRADVRTALKDSDTRASIRDQLAGTLAQIHAVPTRSLLGAASTPAQVSERVQRWIEHARGHVPDIAHVADALAALEAPATDTTALVHGDYRLGNLIYGPEGIRAVIDWEMAHLGDPAEDLAWARLITWQYRPGLVCGLLDPEEWQHRYSVAASVPVDPDRVSYWELFGCVKMAALAVSAGRTRTHERDGQLARQAARLVQRAENLLALR